MGLTKGSAGIIVRAAVYDELSHSDGFRDFLAVISSFRQELVDDLLQGRYSDTRKPGVTDEALRGMIYVLDRVLAIPVEAKSRYDLLRRSESEVDRLKDKYSRLLEGEGDGW